MYNITTVIIYYIINGCLVNNNYLSTYTINNQILRIVTMLIVSNILL